MKYKRGYYSLIQFCPNQSRLETINVGVVLLCPDAGFIEARTSTDNRRAAKLVGSGKLDKDFLNSAKRAIEQRLQVDSASFKSYEDLQEFVNTRGNDLKLTTPRPVKVSDPHADLDNLFLELVEDSPLVERLPSKKTDKTLSPKLDEVFQRLHNDGRAQLDLKVDVPVLGQPLRIPYAYQNGVMNLVLPKRFSNKQNAMHTAERLAIEGDLLQRHSRDSDDPKKLIVISLFSHNNSEQADASKVGQLLDEYKVKNVQENEIDEFVSQVEKEAHSK